MGHNQNILTDPWTDQDLSGICPKTQGVLIFNYPN